MPGTPHTKAALRDSQREWPPLGAFSPDLSPEGESRRRPHGQPVAGLPQFRKETVVEGADEVATAGGPAGTGRAIADHSLHDLHMVESPLCETNFVFAESINQRQEVGSMDRPVVEGLDGCYRLSIERRQAGAEHVTKTPGPARDDSRAPHQMCQEPLEVGIAQSAG